MATSELVQQYTELVERYDILRDRFKKAMELKDRFKGNVVERVVADYHRQQSELEAELAPCEDQMFVLVAEREAEQDQVTAERGTLEEQQDEIQLRHLIGEYTDEVFEERSSQLASDLEKVQERLQSLNEEIDHYRGLLERAGAEERRERRLVAEPPPPPVPDAPAVPLAPVPAPAGPPPAPAATAVPSSRPAPALSIVPSAPAAPPVAPPAPGARTVSPSLHEQVVLPSPPAAPREEQMMDLYSSTAVLGREAEPVAAEPDPASEPPGAGAFDMILDDFSLNQGGGQPGAADVGLSSLGALTELDQDWPGDFPAGGNFHDVLDPPGNSFGGGFGEMSFGDAADPPVLGARVPLKDRAAFLIRNFGRPDEDRYMIQDDVTSIGRGRDNQIQIKDDTKVSRYHCRILREADGFFIEDNNSSNGTMVNSEPITRRKIEGNEDLTIGETLFRFELH